MADARGELSHIYIMFNFWMAGMLGAPHVMRTPAAAPAAQVAPAANAPATPAEAKH